MKTSVAIIMITTLGWMWSELRNKATQDSMTKMEASKDSIIEELRWKATAMDSAMAKDQRMQLRIKNTIDEATKRHK